MERFNGNVQDSRGNAIQNVTVTVYKRETDGSQTLATIYSDNGVLTKANPFTAQDDGEFWFYAENGRYDVYLSGPVSETRMDALLFDAVGEGLSLRFEEETSAPPTDGSVRFNNSDLGAATECYVSTENVAGSDIQDVVEDFFDATRTRKDRIIFKDASFLTQAAFQVDGITDNGYWLTLDISNHSGATSFPDHERLGLSALRAGPDGSMTGPASSTDNAIARWDGTSGAVVQNSDIVIDDSDRMFSGSDGNEGQIGGPFGSALNNYPPNSDLDDVNAMGLNRADGGGSVSNMPTGGGFWHIWSAGISSGEFWQLGFKRNGTDFYARQKNGGTWSSWFQMLTSELFASDSEVRSAATGNKPLKAAHVETAAAFVSLTDGANVSLDWDSGINFTLEMAGDRQLDNPSNGQPGTWRHILVDGNDGTTRTLSFGTQYQTNNIGTLDDITSTKKYLLSIYCITASKFIVFASDGSDP